MLGNRSNVIYTLRGVLEFFYQELADRREGLPPTDYLGIKKS